MTHTARCARCDRVRNLAGRVFRGGGHLCADCLPSCEAALTGWLAMTVGAHDDLNTEGDGARARARIVSAPSHG